VTWQVLCQAFPCICAHLARDEFTHLFEIFLQSSLEVLLFCPLSTNFPAKVLPLSA
jgi:hypothetical protein